MESVLSDIFSGQLILQATGTDAVQSVSWERGVRCVLAIIPARADAIESMAAHSSNRKSSECLVAIRLRGGRGCGAVLILSLRCEIRRAPDVLWLPMNNDNPGGEDRMSNCRRPDSTVSNSKLSPIRSPGCNTTECNAVFLARTEVCWAGGVRPQGFKILYFSKTFSLGSITNSA